MGEEYEDPCPRDELALDAMIRQGLPTMTTKYAPDTFTTSVVAV